jgi:hypothetical protein
MSDNQKASWTTIPDESIPYVTNFDEIKQFQTSPFRICHDDLKTQLYLLSKVVSHNCDEGAKRFDFQVVYIADGLFTICVTAERNV